MMQLSPAGILLIQGSEGFMPKAYWDVNAYSIGYGTHLDTPQLVNLYLHATITEEQGKELMMPKIQASENNINSNVKVPLTQNQFDALVDFTYNLGIGSLDGSTLLKLLNEKNYIGAAGQFTLWDHENGKENIYLKSRREKEQSLFLTKDEIPVSSSKN